MRTTAGQLFVNEALPEKFRDYERVMDKKGVSDLLARVAAEEPNAYKEVSFALHNAGGYVSHATGASFSPRDMRMGPAAKVKREIIRKRVAALINDDSLDDDQRAEAIRGVVVGSIDDMEKTIYDEGMASGNQLALQVHSGSRGKKADLRAMAAGEFMVTDHRNRVIPIPILHGYSEGITPSEYWAAAYGTRKGQADTKLLVGDAGYFGKKLSQASHRQVVTESDCGTEGGIPVDAQDADNVGCLLARDYGDLKMGTPIDAQVLRQLGKQKILVRSPLTCRAHQGVCAKCVGIRERGGLPEIGDAVGLTAAQSVAERVSQGALGSKHGGGRASKDTDHERLSGLPLLTQFIDMPSDFRDAAALAQVDGVVESIDKAPQGGQFVTIEGEQHYVPDGFGINVKPGQRVSRGQVLSEGWVNPAATVGLRGLGAARLQLVNSYRDALKSVGVTANRRNLEIVARGLLNHVKVTEFDGTDGLPDDVLEYGELESTYRPRFGFRQQQARKSIGMYLEKPALYHTIGTLVTKDVADELEEQGIKDVSVHKDPPPFEPLAVRAMETSMRSPDWQVRLGGSYLQKGLLEAAQRGRKSEMHGTSFIPALLKGTEFGKDLRTTGEY